ncbi:MAG: alpha/beta hydrolase [Planctomycetes bacterium]|nr:alpha/beta hydrolase [Planctomycetota bacterium]
MPLLHAPDVDIWYEDRGAGPPLALLGGLTNVPEVFEPMAAVLEPGWRVIRPDNRGSGRTKPQPDDGERAPARFASDLRALLDGLSLQRAHVAGFSLGAMIALEFAVTWPERLLSLTLGCAAPFSLADPRATKPDPETLAPFTDPTPLPREAEDARTLRNIAHPDTPRLRPERARFYCGLRWTWPHAREEVFARLAGVARWSAFERLSRLAGVPVLVLTGEVDRLVPIANSRLIAQNVPGAELVTLPRTGHVFFAEEPEETARLIAGFIARRAPTPA